MAQPKTKEKLTSDSPRAFINRELSWLRFARRVLEMAKDAEVPLLERMKFAGILGMLHDEFFMKRVSGLKRQVNKGVNKLSLDGRTPTEELAACRKEVLKQNRELSRRLSFELRPALASHGIGIGDINGDALPDVLSTDPQSGKHTFYLNKMGADGKGDAGAGGGVEPTTSAHVADRFSLVSLWPVSDAATRQTVSGVPAGTTTPPSSPPSGPKSMT